MVMPRFLQPFLPARSSQTQQVGVDAPIPNKTSAQSHYSLSIRWDDDCLLMSLNQDDQLLCVGILEDYADHLTRFQAQAQSGHALFDLLFPKRIQSFLLSTPSASLALRIDARLSEIPWELASVQGIKLSDLHTINRTLLTPLPGTDPTHTLASQKHSLLGQDSGSIDKTRALRQLTILSYDLVGSTQMMREMGVERYSLLLDQTHLKFASVIKKWDGQADPPMGDDGIMCYFGLPLARSGAPQKALSAALELLGEALILGIRIRVGVATGMVAVNASHKVGPAIHLAARLQCLTEPGTVSVCSETRQLTRHLFNWGEEYTLAHLKGFGPEVRVAHLLQERNPQNPETWTNLSRWPLVGRTQEMEWLRAQWREAAQVHGRMIEIEGEAGIGKSKLVSAFAKERQAAHTPILVCRCSPNTMTRPFAPVVDMLERLFQIETHTPSGTREQHLVQTFAQKGMSAASQRLSRLLLGLRDIASPTKNILTRKELLGLMVKWVQERTSRQPVLLLIKDVHWADPSTLAFLEQLALSLESAKVLVVVTRRIESLAPTHLALPFHAVLRMQALSIQEASDLVQLVRGHQDLPPDAVQVVLDKAQGVPLFVEELTRYLLTRPHDDLNILTLPATVQEVLLQRLDHLGPNKRVAQLCSVLGREISWPLLLQLWKLLSQDADELDHRPDVRLRAGFQALQDSGLIARKKTRGDPVYFFRHAMIEDAAYHSMWQLDRSQLHRLVANLLEEAFPRICDEHPDLLAHHWSLAEAYEKALSWSLKAASMHKRTETHLEALVQMRFARQWLDHLPDSRQKNRYLLAIELQTAGQLIGVKGYSDPLVEQAYRHALHLAQLLNDRKSLLKAQMGLEVYHLVRGNLEQAHAFVEQALATAQGLNDALTLAHCDWAVASILFHQGDAALALEKIDACIDHCRAIEAGRDLVPSPEVIARTYGGICAWLLGEPEQALERGLAAVCLAERLGHRVSLGQALGVLAMVHWARGEWEQVRATSIRALAVFEERDHDLWRAQAQFMRGLAMAAMACPSDMQDGLNEMEVAQTHWSSTGAKLSLTFFQALRAQMLGRFGRHQEALALIDHTLALVECHGERYFEAEVWRIKGELLLRESICNEAIADQPPSPAILAQAHQCFAMGLQVARQHQMRSFELRCLCSAARYPLNPLQHTGTIGALRSCLGQFTQGQATGDVMRARQILQLQADQ